MLPGDSVWLCCEFFVPETKCGNRHVIVYQVVPNPRARSSGRERLRSGQFLVKNCISPHKTETSVRNDCGSSVGTGSNPAPWRGVRVDFYRPPCSSLRCLCGASVSEVYRKSSEGPAVSGEKLRLLKNRRAVSDGLPGIESADRAARATSELSGFSGRH